VPDHVGPLDAGVAHHGHHVAGEVGDRVVVDLRRLVRPAVAAQVRDDHLEPRLGQDRHLVPPQAPAVREAVEQHERTAFPGDLVLDAYAIDVDAHSDLPSLPQAVCLRH
jgi:hypothetical protein